jgi:hypothetical protein
MAKKPARRFVIGFPEKHLKSEPVFASHLARAPAIRRLTRLEADKIAKQIGSRVYELVDVTRE